MFWQAFTYLVAFVPAAVMAGIIWWRVRQFDQETRREAITTELRNLPGASLQSQREEFGKNVLANMAASLYIGFALTIPILARRVTSDLSTWDWLDTVFVLGVIGSGIYYARELLIELPRVRHLKHALRAEQATAQEIATSLAGNNRIIHDIQTGDFNIDHVVITAAGVFAVETKSRLKPPVGQGAAGVKVRYDGKRLEFPGWSETKPVEQAARQATWLRNHLKQSTGDSFPVFPVLSLPGWYIENTKKITDDMVRVINPKNCQWLLVPEKAPRLDPSAIQRAAFAIEKLAQVPDESAK